MKTIFLSYILCITCINIFAQKPIDELINTEKSFAATSKEQTTKIAFLSFLDSSCVGFRNGESINLFEEYSKRKEDSSKLTWAPEFAVISSSGDMGVTTGPWEYRQKSLNDTPVAHGHFTTIWKKKSNGKWKAIFDMGIGYNQKFNNSNNVERLVLTKPGTNDKSEIPIVNVDLNFSDAFEIDKNYATNKVIANNSWFSVDGFPPAKGASAIRLLLSNYTDSIKFSLPQHYFFSKNMDMFALCGKAQTGNIMKAYMRLWVKENNEWKLLMMVIH